MAAAHAAFAGDLTRKSPFGKNILCPMTINQESEWVLSKVYAISNIVRGFL
jgi:hypothetical protein